MLCTYHLFINSTTIISIGENQLFVYLSIQILFSFWIRMEGAYDSRLAADTMVINQKGPWLSSLHNNMAWLNISQSHMPSWRPLVRSLTLRWKLRGWAYFPEQKMRREIVKYKGYIFQTIFREVSWARKNPQNEPFTHIHAFPQHNARSIRGELLREPIEPHARYTWGVGGGSRDKKWASVSSQAAVEAVHVWWSGNLEALPVWPMVQPSWSFGWLELWVL